METVITRKGSRFDGTLEIDGFFKRFILRGRDPAIADENLYRYCENEPLTRTDPTGLASVPAPAQDVQAQLDAGMIAFGRGNANPDSIEMTTKGTKPFITVNTLKPAQQGGPRTEPNDNPWFSRGGANMKIGDSWMVSTIALEWVIAFDSKPSPGQWGRNVWTNAFVNRNYFRTNRDGSVQLFGVNADDTDLPNDYIVGKKVYMYDMPGRPIGGTPEYVFEVWAKSCNGKKRISKWYFVKPSAGEFYEINAPGPPTPHFQYHFAPRTDMQLF